MVLTSQHAGNTTWCNHSMCHTYAAGDDDDDDVDDDVSDDGDSDVSGDDDDDVSDVN